jgi:hypothetical protein
VWDSERVMWWLGFVHMHILFITVCTGVGLLLSTRLSVVCTLGVVVSENWKFSRYYWRSVSSIIAILQQFAYCVLLCWWNKSFVWVAALCFGVQGIASLALYIILYNSYPQSNEIEPNVRLLCDCGIFYFLVRKKQNPTHYRLQYYSIATYRNL